MKAGEVLAGKYKLVKQLGEGGEGSVYLAIHIQTEMFWAIKEIHAGMEEEGEYFCHELQMMKRLKNRHLPEIIDVFRQGNCTYLVMEHVRGVSMDHRIRNGTVLSVDEVRDTAVQVTEALCYLESRDSPICHLDIKPSNLILRPDGLIKLVDFGSAWKEEGERRRMVTDGYAAPEQYREDGIQPDTRTDIYSLGATLYRMISGTCWSESLRGDPIPDCPQELSSIIFRCLQEEPSDRFQSADDLMDALENMNRKKRWERGRVRILGALAMALPAAALCLQILPSVIDLSADESWDYEKLIREAGVVDEEKSREYYRKAVFMKPSDSEAYLRCLSDIQRDGVLSDEEELFLRDTLHTVRLGSDDTYEEILAQDPREYLVTALQIGLAYWYGSDREDARRIALGWFEKACEAADKVRGETADGNYAGQETADGDNVRRESVDGDNAPESSGSDSGNTDPVSGDMNERKLLKCMEEAELYLKFGTAAQKLDSPDAEEAGVNALEYWQEMKTFLQKIEKTDILEDPLIQLKFIREALSAVTFISQDLNTAGIGADEQKEMTGRLAMMAENVQLPDYQAKIGEQILEEIRYAGDTAKEAADNLSQAGKKEEFSQDRMRKRETESE